VVLGNAAPRFFRLARRCRRVYHFGLPKLNTSDPPGSIRAKRRLCGIPRDIHILLDPLSQIRSQALGVASLTSCDAIPGNEMRQRSRAGDDRVKKRRGIKPRIAPKVVRRRSTSAAAQEARIAQLTRLLHEALEHQTATSEVLRIISSSPGELNSVFQAMLANATKLCEASYGTMWLCEGDAFRVAALYGSLPAAYMEQLRSGALFRLGPNLPAVQAINSRRPVQVPDLRLSRPYLDREPLAVAAVELAGICTMFAVPMFKDNEPVGAIAIYRQEMRPFTEKHIELVQDFAAQAVIAIDNTRLLSELRQRTDDLTESLENLRIAQDRLVQTEKLASLGQLTAGIAHEIKNPLNFVNNFSALSVELVDELRGALGGVHLDDKRRGEINEITDTLRDNLDKVVQHGKRADAIVRNMLLHSRQGSGEYRPVDINVIVEESLNLAYQAARAEKQGFEITLERSFDPAAGQVDLFPQEITRVLLNLISNGFYAATKRKTDTNGGDYEPVLVAGTKNLGNCVEIRIRDNGTGMSPEVTEKIFNPFFTTKPAGEGTGLGLSISHDIIVKQHGGSIEVDTKQNEFTELRIVLPRKGGALVKLNAPATNPPHR
jgi:signal transduction histidine kinase